MNDLISLRDEIEKLDKRQHIDIIKIIQENKVEFTENRNGVFLNMKDLNKICIKKIKKYLTYIDIQQTQLSSAEKIKKTYVNNFFKSNKGKEQ
jgi:hypothetical protein